MNEILKQNKTAFYVFDVKTLKDRVAYLRKMLPEDVAICYAIKANTFITAELENDVDRFEICSRAFGIVVGINAERRVQAIRIASRRL